MSSSQINVVEDDVIDVCVDLPEVPTWRLRPNFYTRKLDVAIACERKEIATHSNCYPLTQSGGPFNPVTGINQGELVGPGVGAIEERNRSASSER